MNESIRFREADEGDRDAILALGSATFGSAHGSTGNMQSDAYKRDPAYWTWQFRRGYAGTATIFVAESRDRIVGHLGFLPQEYETPVGPARAALAVDAMVHPEFHRNGIFSALTRHAAASLREHFAFTLALQIQKASLGGMLAGGWRAIDRLPVLLKPISFSHLGRDFGLRLPERSNAHQPPPCVQPITPGDFATLGAVHRRETVRQPRTTAFARWRYVERPFTTYAIDGWFERDELRAAVVHRHAVLKGVRTLAIVDAAAAPSGESSLRMLIKEVCRSTADTALAAALLSRDHPARRVLRECGFFAGPHRFNLLAQVFDRRHAAVIEVPWSLCWGDTDHL